MFFWNKTTYDAYKIAYDKVHEASTVSQTLRAKIKVFELFDLSIDSKSVFPQDSESVIGNTKFRL